MKIQLNYTTNKSRVKNRFALGALTLCTDKLFHLYQDQPVALNEIVEADAKQYEAKNKSYELKEWLSPSAPGRAGDIITITSPLKYKVPVSKDKQSPTIQQILERS
ncbi:uncharacterized protein LACBIDRAFT_302985 [Laccaria bicolor S238N-H82]|uniref:Predicted protein n=1 Tax=Laccaria bicolor (strain S238N-H82 / ATCC MYA-4686) TaxID=486041 RepID=B0DIR3_LACBS|nr:uncharacterized protein LACBIDRAFT_302985 [Laccaria bicolor S238N-H82]EDR05730.1 predicted protein [Laccaria bicolor S238N-H82]|eukprot:XP_001883834.1 predicted protein [Laccaria bicolor S238N-H82]